ncbi:serine/threonine-protein kinase MARK1-like [Periplaneta americana]|uniref:serine/threonine-protein kinase MARK1-like n=1 Tax=Periplaneta americana TaxID=6978 RepID=UPI0037E78D0C
MRGLLFQVAVKIIDTSKVTEEYVVRNLEREARVLSRLSHPSIQCLFETMQCGPLYYLVTELATGGDLCAHIKQQRNGRLDERTARRYGRQLVSALAHMHNRGVVHRDLKTENIMLDATKERVKIVDFGLSNTWGPDRALKTHCGSPEYAAPELFIMGQNYGPEVDLWSLGVVLYGMVVGRLPFITPRTGEMSSSERRRHLLTQINRGLTHYHRKTLCPFSGDFWNLISHLLVPNVQKRMTLAQMVIHPWVTGRQRVLENQEYKNLTAAEKNTILKRIAVFLGAERGGLEQQLRMNRYGKVGGMFNILAHMQRVVNQELEGRSWAAAKTLVRPSTSACTPPTGQRSSTAHALRLVWSDHAKPSAPPSRLRVVGSHGVTAQHLNQRTVASMEHRSWTTREPVRRDSAPSSSTHSRGDHLNIHGVGRLQRADASAITDSSMTSTCSSCSKGTGDLSRHNQTKRWSAAACKSIPRPATATALPRSRH